MDSDQAKLFVGGISWETSEETLKDHFSKYGDVVESVIMRDKNTGSARGFGFVLFSDPSVADKALQDKHVILGRTVEVKKAVPRGDRHHHHHPQQQNKGSSRNGSNGGNDNQFRTKKIFVGGLSSSLTEEEFRNYFEKFGRTTDVVVMYDSVTHRPRGFGFITFDSEESVEGVMQKNFHELNDKVVEVKRAVPKDGNSSGNGNGANMRAGGGGRGFLNGGNRGVAHPSYNTRYWMFPGYTPPPFPGYGGIGAYPYGAHTYGGGYPIGGYSGIGYGTPPIVVPRSPWYGPAILGARQSPVLYGDAANYPGYMNGGVLGLADGDNPDITRPAANGKWKQSNDGDDAQVPGNTMSPQYDGGKLEDDLSGLSASNGASAVKQNQRGPDGRHSSCPVTY